MSRQAALRGSLLLMRLTVFLVMLMWTLDKFTNPGHAAKVFENYYLIAGLKSKALAVLAAAELMLPTGFFAGRLQTYLL